MSEVIIAVRGESERRVAPERATVRVSVRAEGAERADTVAHALTLAEPVRAGLADRADAGTLADWTSTRLSVRAERPWNHEGKRLAPVYYASIDFTATFRDAADLSDWATDVATRDGVEVGGVDWYLTPETRAAVERDVAASAVAVAVARAEAYASALGLRQVSAREIADVGLLSSGPGDPSPPLMMKARTAAFAAESAPGMEYEPEDIVVTATVEARFTAS